MWGIEFAAATSKVQLPLMTTEGMMGLAIALLALNILLRLFLEKVFCVAVGRKEHSPNSLEYSYFYHLCIIILVLPDLHWNMFDLACWLFSYACIGMLRKVVHILNVERTFLLSDFAYNPNIISLITGSQLVAVSLLLLSVVAILWAHISFLGVAMKVLSLLCFPCMLLGIDCVFLLALSKKTRENLVYFFNQNINGEPPLLKLELYHKIVGSATRIWHFANLSFLCFFMIYDKIDFLDCLWVISALAAFYYSSVEMVSSIAKYKKTLALTAAINTIISRSPTSIDRICVICMEPLLNSFRLHICGHIFHYKCLCQWIQTKEECPVCRVRIHIRP